MKMQKRTFGLSNREFLLLCETARSSEELTFFLKQYEGMIEVDELMLNQIYDLHTLVAGALEFSSTPKEFDLWAKFFEALEALERSRTRFYH